MVKSYSFNYHEDSTSEFLKYMWVSLMSGDFHDLMEATDAGKEITLSIFANGIEVDAQHLMEGLERNFDRNVKNAVDEYVNSAQLSTLMNAIQTIEKDIRIELRNRLEDVGIEPLEEWDE